VPSWRWRAVTTRLPPWRRSSSRHLPRFIFPAVGDTARLAVSATDVDGRSISPRGIQFTSRDPLVVTVSSTGLVQSAGDGSTYVVVQSEGLRDSARITVAQARDSLVLSLAVASPILSLPTDAPIPLRCRSFDAQGIQVPLVTTLSSRQGVVAGSSCGSATIVQSGHDTLDVSAGPYQTSLAIVAAIAPTVLSDPATPLNVDSLPAGLVPWAPTLVRNSTGQLDLYFAGYRNLAGHLGERRGDLHRLTSADGHSFRYEGIVLRRDAFPCSPRGTGIENIAIVPRAESAGWRMYYSAGSDCDGWQVFSATSDDEDTWHPEPGVRIPNGTTPLWPSGEGMVVEQGAGGTWRMLVGSSEQINPPENRFQITQWTSSDQLAWTYGGPVLTTRQVGPAAARSVYSPTVTDIAPGLKRMFFTGDNLDSRGGSSRIYSALSDDGTHWQVEGVVLGGGEEDYFYSSLVGDLLVFIRTVKGVHRLGSVRIGPLVPLP
jgi:hypothetical protein